MIKRLKIQNFQSHKSSILEFSDGVNVIMGTTDSGKSAILRSIYWLNENRPLGIDSIKSTVSEGNVFVELENENFVISREKGKIDEYHLSGIQDAFRAFGTSVPDEILKALNIQPINYQKQIDAPFLFSNSPGYVAEHFNKMSNIQVTDKSIQFINTQINKLQSIIGKPSIKNNPATGLHRDLEKWNTQLSDYDFLDFLEIDLEVLEQLQDSLKVSSARQEKLKKLIAGILYLQEKIDEKQQFLNLEIEVNQILGMIESRDKGATEIEELESLIDSLDETTKKSESLEQLLRLEQSVERITDLIAQKAQMIEESDKLKTNLYNIKELEESLEMAIQNSKRFEKEFKANMPEVCPLCGK